jgi:VWFA-related protein
MIFRAAPIAAVATLWAQQAPAPQQLVFRGATELVRVDTVVTDREGKLIHGLTKNDFEIYDNGKRQEVAAFAEVTRPRRTLNRAVAPPHVDVAANSGGTADRLVIIVLDDLATRTYHTDRVKEAVGRFLHELGGELQMALLRTSGRPGVEFTTDPRILLNAIGAFEGEAMLMDGRGGNYLGVERGPGRGRGIGGTSRPGAGGGLTMIEDALQYLSPTDGRRKILLFVSEASGGVDPRDAAAMTDPAKSQADRLRAQKQWIESLPRVDGRRTLIELAHQANAAIYAIDPRGLAKPGQEGFAGGSGVTAGMPFQNNDVARKGQATLSVIAALTGGYAVVNTDDFAAGVDRIVEELDNYYVLGFVPPDAKATKPHEIEVRVKRPDAEPRYRREYVLNTGPTKTDKAAAKDALLGLAHSPVPNGDLPLRLWAAILPPRGSATEANVALWLESAEASVTEYAVYVIDMKKAKEVGKPTGRTLNGVVPDILPLDAPALLPGRYQLRVSARSADAKRGGSVYLTLEIPDFAKAPLVLTGVVLGDGDTTRRDLGSLPFPPVFDRTFDSSTTIRVAFDVWRSAPADVQIRIELLNATGTAVRTMSDTMSASSRGHVEAPLTFRGLTPGVYTLRLSATSGVNRTEETIAVAIK